MDGETIPARRGLRLVQRMVWWLSHFWFGLALLLPLSFLLLAVLAPALLRDGRESAADAVYGFMRRQNHQLPERSYFLFGAEGGIAAYDLSVLQAAGMDPEAPEEFRGNQTLGYKTALNQRMIAIFSGALLGGLLWLAVRGRLTVGSWWLLLLLATPMLLDVFSHVFTETQAGEWRLLNEWARPLFGAAPPARFYTGNTIGTLNWLLRSSSGFIFGGGLALFLVGRFDTYFRWVRAVLGPRMRRRLR